MGIIDSLGAIGVVILCVGATVGVIAGIVYLIVTVAKWAWGG